MNDLISIMRELSCEWIGNDETKVTSFLSRFKEFYDSHERHQYSQITAYVYGIDDSDRELLGENLEILLKEADFAQENVVKQIGKIIDHINLAASQKTLIENLSYNALEIAERRTEVLRKQWKKIQEQAKIMDGEIEGLKEKERSLVTQFVTILGIFASIIFAAFGGFQVISNTINHLSDDLRIGKLMIFSSMVMIGVVVLLYILLSGIAKITGQNFKSCGCEEESHECDHTLAEKYPAFSIVLIILFYFFFIGISAFIFDYGLIFKSILDIKFISWLQYIAIAVLVLWPVPMLWRHFSSGNLRRVFLSCIKMVKRTRGNSEMENKKGTTHTPVVPVDQLATDDHPESKDGKN